MTSLIVPLRILRFIGLSIFFGFVAGVIHYLFVLAQLDNAEIKKVDAAIVLTGGPDRLADAAKLLSSGATQHLLISGVGGHADLDDLIHVVPALAPYATCCIVLGHQALNTRGNAEEAAQWVNDHHYKSVAIVTAGFHLPRAMLEFRVKLPDHSLYPYRAGLSLKDQILNGRYATLYAMGLEPIKYVAAMVRLGLLNRFTDKTA